MRYNVNMQSMIIVGAAESRNNYIQLFIKDNKIPRYNVTHLQETIKIADAREIKKRLSFSSGENPRVIILPQEITLDAQNALLKTIEELDTRTYIIIESESRDVLLPTIISRCLVVMLPREDTNLKNTTPNELSSLFNDIDGSVRTGAVLHYIDALGTVTEESIKQIILDARELLIQNISGSSKKIQSILIVLKSLLLLYPLCQNNNINKRMMLETVFLGKLGLDKALLTLIS